jgi:DNA recombination-dependent growth factor C
MFSARRASALADFLFSPDQLPRSFCDTWQLTQALGQATLAGQNLAVDTAGMAETNRFLSDVRYLVGSIAVPRGKPLFRWNEKDGNKETALKEWIKQGSPNLEPLLTGCAWQPCCRTPTTPPAAMPTACRARIR